MHPSRVTLRSVARKMGLHHSTISLALRGSPLIAATTQQRVKEAAREMGYVPDPVLSALNAYRQQQRPARRVSTLAWVVSEADSLAERSSAKAGAALMDGARARAADLGYRIETFTLGPSAYNVARLAEVLASRGINGLLLSGGCAPGVWAGLSAFSIVCVGSDPAGRLNCVRSHGFECGALIIDRLRALGYCRIGLAAEAPESDAWSRELLGAFLSDAHQQPPSFRVSPLAPGCFELAQMDRWIQEEKVECIVGDHRRLLPMLDALDYRVPKHIALASTTLTSEDAGVAGIERPCGCLGHTALDLLAGMIQRNETGVPACPRGITLPAHWRDGRSVPQKPAVS